MGLNRLKVHEKLSVVRRLARSENFPSSAPDVFRLANRKASGTEMRLVLEPLCQPEYTYLSVDAAIAVRCCNDAGTR